MRVWPLGNEMVYEQPGFVGIIPVEFKAMTVSCASCAHKNEAVVVGGTA